ncbi:MAG: hypothetical protein D6725_02730 [Planctomycetota bacterium]|nr:MAG: hypothetical protein D6725_02730 [Planctomycetota bacterium]
MPRNSTAARVRSLPRRVLELTQLALVALTFFAGYVFLRYSYQVAEPYPFSQEFVLVVLGTLATAMITSLLLHKQTEAELSKEQAVKYIELKSSVYTKLIDDVERLAARGKLDRADLRHLEYLVHRIAIVGSPEVLRAYGEFIRGVGAAFRDSEVSEADSDLVMRHLATLTIALRRDLIGELDAAYPELAASIERDILDNAERSADTF